MAGAGKGKGGGELGARETRGARERERGQITSTEEV